MVRTFFFYWILISLVLFVVAVIQLNKGLMWGAMPIALPIACIISINKAIKRLNNVDEE